MCLVLTDRYPLPIRISEELIEELGVDGAEELLTKIEDPEAVSLIQKQIETMKVKQIRKKIKAGG